MLLNILWNQRFFDGSKEKHLLEIGMFCNIINVLTVNFDQINIFLLNKKVFISSNK